MPSRIAVVGPGGYLGLAIVQALLRSGHQVTGVAPRLPAAWPAGTIFQLCDATDADALSRAAGDCDAIINAMAGPPANMVRVAHGLAGLRAGGWRGRLVHFSSLAVYGDAVGLLDETSPACPSARHRYAHAKLATETILMQAPAADQTVILRAGCIYGPGAPVWVDRLCRLLLAARLGWLWDEGAGNCNLIHVDDMARIAVAALATGGETDGVHNVTGAEAITWNIYIRRLAIELGMDILPRMSRARLDLETYLNSPAQHILVKLGLPVAGPITPAMRRLFRSQAHIVSRRRPMLAPDQTTRLQAGLSAAVADFRRRTPLPLAAAPPAPAPSRAAA